MDKPPPNPSLINRALQSAGYGFATWQLHEWSQQGTGWAGPAALATAVLFTVKSLQFLVGYQSFCFQRRKFARFKATAEELAGGRLAIESELEKYGLLCSQGIYLGTWIDRRGRRSDIRYDGQNACLLLGPPEAGKTTSALIPSLLPVDGRKGSGIGHAAVLNDPNGEAYAILKDALEEAGCRLICLCPFHAELSAKLGVPFKDAGLNIWSQLDLKASPADKRAVIVDIAAMLIT